MDGWMEGGVKLQGMGKKGAGIVTLSICSSIKSAGDPADESLSPHSCIKILSFNITHMYYFLNIQLRPKGKVTTEEKSD